MRKFKEIKTIYLIIVIVFSFIKIGLSQTTNFPRVTSATSFSSKIQISKIELSKEKTLVYLEFVEFRNNFLGPWIKMNSKSFIKDNFTGETYKIISLEDGLNLDVEYRTNKSSKYNFTLVFEPIPPGTNNIDIYQDVAGGFRWNGVILNNPDAPPQTNWNEQSLKIFWEENGLDDIEGLYENINSEKLGNKYFLGLKKDGSNYLLIYLGGNVNSKWKIGDIKAHLVRTAIPNTFKAKYFMSNKSTSEDLYIGFDSGFMKVIWTDGSPETNYIKLFPTNSSSGGPGSGIKSSGTGFAISSSGYLVTNYHVIENAKKIYVKGVKGDYSISYSADLIISDSKNDLAILKISDPKFSNLGEIPYKFDINISEVGKNVFALGYPLRSTMGDEVKLTNGIISSKTGFQGDVTTYQVSVPVQPGNSGGPLFDTNGNVIGIINSKHSNAENVSYAIKTSYLFNLIQTIDSGPLLPNVNSISNLNLSDQFKNVKNFVYIIDVEN